MSKPSTSHVEGFFRGASPRIGTIKQDYHAAILTGLGFSSRAIAERLSIPKSRVTRISSIVGISCRGYRDMLSPASASIANMALKTRVTELQVEKFTGHVISRLLGARLSPDGLTLYKPY